MYVSRQGPGAILAAAERRDDSGGNNDGQACQQDADSRAPMRIVSHTRMRARFV
jgi:hypothetical protein